MDFYKKEVDDIIQDLKSNKEEGLTIKEAYSRLEKFGYNEIKKIKKFQNIKLFINQFKSYIIYILLAAAIISFLLKHMTDSIIILIIVVLNSVIGFYQDFKAERSIEALKKLSQREVTVIREGRKGTIFSKDLVPGDIVLIEEGNYIPADCRLIEISSLGINESSLTGESAPVNKDINTINKDVTLADQKNMIFSGTIAVRGRAKAIVISTGFETEIGKIARSIQEEENLTPMQKQLNKFGVYVTIGIIILVTIIFSVDYIISKSFVDALLISIALAVAALPEGLIAVITVTLALATQRMVKKKALVRRLPAVEVLGSITVICSDKTGTLTKNEMTIQKIFMDGFEYSVTGLGYNSKGSFIKDNKKVDPKIFSKLLEIGLLCNNASLDTNSDPTEKSLIVLAKKANFTINSKRLREIPFSSEKKYMATINNLNNKNTALAKGAPEVILKMCKYIYNGDRLKPLTPKDRQAIEESYKNMSSNALRVIALAYSKNDEIKDLVFVGLVGMIDPPREEAKTSLALCEKAGIRVIMITGDGPLTAKAIATEIGIKGDVLTGDELNKLNKNELVAYSKRVNIYARVNPEHKVKILNALKFSGEIVAMTGDGVNDAPALKKSDIGIAVGSGTDVAKESSDIILLDDNFATIVGAIKEGRGVYANLKKFIKYLFSSNLAEVLIIFLALIIGFKYENNFILPLTAIQILWVNLITDGFPALALGVDKVKEDVMNKKPRNKHEKIITREDFSDIFIQSVMILVIVLGLFTYYLNFKTVIYAQTIAFSALVFTQLYNSLNYRLNGSRVFSKELFANHYLILAIIGSFLLQLGVIYLFGGWFKTIPISFLDLIIVVLASSPLLFFYSIKKLLTKTTS